MNNTKTESARGGVGKLKLTKAALLSHSPCSEACKFIAKHKGLKSMWKACENADWMIWALSRFNMLDERTARQFAVACAEHTLHFFEDKYPNDKRPREAIEFARRLIDKPELVEAAACYAARSAAWSAAEAAACSAARSAARSAAWSAAWSAAGSAACSAARSAAEAAACSAAWSAAEAAAWSAAEAAAWSAAWSAENKWQADKLRELINPFKK